jgi:hypothetical protein
MTGEPMDGTPLTTTKMTVCHQNVNGIKNKDRSVQDLHAGPGAKTAGFGGI